MEYNGRLVTELSFFNERKLYREILVNKMFDQQVVRVRPIPKTDKEIPSFELRRFDGLNYSLKTENNVMANWTQSIKTFSHTYNKVMQRQSRKNLKTEQRKKFFHDVTLETEKQTQILFTKYPCLELKFRIKGHQNQLKEVVFTEKFIKQLGHSTGNMAALILQEGLPRLMPYDNPLSDSVIMPLLENYFKIEDCGYEIPELESVLLIKNGFARDIKFKTYFFMNYEANTFGLDCLLAFSAFGEPYLYSQKSLDSLLSKEFIEFMSQRESQSPNLFAKYYDREINERYTGRTCRIKQLDLNVEEEDIRMKKCEEETADDSVI